MAPPPVADGHVPSAATQTKKNLACDACWLAAGIARGAPPGEFVVREKPRRGVRPPAAKRLPTLPPSVPCTCAHSRDNVHATQAMTSTAPTGHHSLTHVLRSSMLRILTVYVERAPVVAHRQRHGIRLPLAFDHPPQQQTSWRSSKRHRGLRSARVTSRSTSALISTATHEPRP
jgi:hypothetical protein